MKPTPAIVAAAAQWAAELDADAIEPSRRQACEDWCLQDPRHRLTLDRMRGLDARLTRLDGAGASALRRVLTRPSERTRRRGGVALAVLLAVGATTLAGQSFAVRSRFAGYETRIGEVRHVAMADGSRLDIDTAAALDAKLTARTRKVTLYRGQVLAHVARDPGAPFVVETRHGTATALGTAYLVRDEGGSTLVTVIESTVRLCAKGGADACVVLHAGDRGRVARGRVQRLAAIDPHAAASWAGGWLEADDQPLAEVLIELNRYRSRPVVFDPSAVVGLRVTGAYPLADTDRAVESLAQTNGLKLTRQADATLRLTR